MASTGEVWKLGYRPALDGLRGIAVLLVVAYHAGISGFQHGGGSVGVLVFFTLSGFLITRLLLEERSRRGRVNLPRFYWRRALRLLPAALAYLAVLMLVGVAFDFPVATPGDVMRVLLYVYNWPAALGNPPSPALAHLWSLSVEEQFYLVWPALLLVGLRYLTTRTVLALTLVAAAASTLLRVELYEPSLEGALRVYYGSDTRVDGLLIGCALALATHRRGCASRPALATIAVGGILWCVPVDGTPRLVIVPLIVPLLTVVVLAFGSGARWMSSRWLVTVGQRSYGLYLWHVVPVVLVMPHSPLPRLVDLVWAFAASWGLTYLSWRFVEKPFLRLKDSSLRERQGRQGSGPVSMRSVVADAPVPGRPLLRLGRRERTARADAEAV